ncbi:unnamed protein product, partial [Nesidiocoris tenuis]
MRRSALFAISSDPKGTSTFTTASNTISLLPGELLHLVHTILPPELFHAVAPGLPDLLSYAVRGHPVNIGPINKLFDFSHRTATWNELFGYGASDEQ